MKFQKNKKNNMLKKTIFFTVLFSVLAIFSSCFVDYDLDTNNYDIVATNHNPDYNFSQVTKFAFVDSVVHLGEDQVSHAYDQQIMDRVLSNLNSLGWTRVYDTTASLIIMLGTTSSTTTVYGSSGWWGYYGWYGGWGYYPWYGGGSGWYYPYYPTYSYSYTYSTGSLVITMADPNSSHEQLTAQWIAVINGLLNSSDVTSRVNTGIDQAFAQSPYLR